MQKEKFIFFYKTTLTVEDGLLLKGDRILIPPTLRPEILDIIHQGHLGQEKCLLRARTCVFWPRITKDIINKVNQCEPCQKYQRKAPKEPILQPQPPCRPWERLSSDMFQFKKPAIPPANRPIQQISHHQET